MDSRDISDGGTVQNRCEFFDLMIDGRHSRQHLRVIEKRVLVELAV